MARSNGRYGPYECLSVPYVHNLSHLYEPLTEGERVKLCRLLVTGESHFKGEAKGCGVNIDKLEAEEEPDDNDASTEVVSKFCLGVFPLHNEELKDQLENKWMPLKKPNGTDIAQLPVDDIMEYFGEEIGNLLHWLACPWYAPKHVS